MNPIRIALAQTAWEPGQMERKFQAMAKEARLRGATLFCLPEFALSPYFALRPKGEGTAPVPEPIPGGISCTFFSELARANSLFVQGSLLEEGFDTSVVFAPDGALVGACRKQHIRVPVYRSDQRQTVRSRCPKTGPSSNGRQVPNPWHEPFGLGQHPAQHSVSKGSMTWPRHPGSQVRQKRVGLAKMHIARTARYERKPWRSWR